MSCGVGCRHSSDPVLLWLWCRPVATAPIRPLAWEPPYAAGAALEKAKRQKTKQTNKQQQKRQSEVNAKEKCKQSTMGRYMKELLTLERRLGSCVAVAVV